MKKYSFNVEEFKENMKLIENIYNLSFLLDLFCQNNKNDESIWHITVLVNSIKNNADKLYSAYINKE